MSEFWANVKSKMLNFFMWAMDNHPGKLIGTTVGFFTGLLMVTLGFWRTLVLLLFVLVGFILGKRQDEHKDVSAWFKKRM